MDIQVPIHFKDFEEIVMKKTIPYLGLYTLSIDRHLNTTAFRVDKSTIYTYTFPMMYLNEYFHDLINAHKTQLGAIQMKGEMELFKLIIIYLSYGNVYILIYLLIFIIRLN